MTELPKIKWVKLEPWAKLPELATPHSVGYDVWAKYEMKLAYNRHLYRTGIAIAGMPPGYFVRVAPRSGLALNWGIQIHDGTIDPDYHGEIKIIVFGDVPTHLKDGLVKIAQFIITPYAHVTWEETSELPSLKHEGFGSTGVK